jgi:protein-disulfide isomerase
MLKKILLSSLLLCSSVMASEKFEPSQEFKDKINIYLQSATSQEVGYFKAEHDLIGIALVGAKYRKMVFYTNNNADFIISGAFIDTTSGANLTEKYVSNIDIDVSDLVTELESAHGSVQGDKNGENIIYAVIDVNCGYCHKSWDSFQQLFDSGVKNTQVKWIPVGFLGSDSVNKAQFILGKPETEQFGVISDLMSKVNVPVNKLVMDLGSDKVSFNETLMKKRDYRGVPLIVSKVNGVWSVTNGAPRPDFYAALKVQSQDSDVKPIEVTE